MPGRHKHGPVCFRPSDDDREWLEAHARETGVPVNRLMTTALRMLRAAAEERRRDDDE